MSENSGSGARDGGPDQPAPSGPRRRTTPRRPAELACQRCGFPVPDRAWGCKNPCPNCGVVYPLGDCSD